MIYRRRAYIMMETLAAFAVTAVLVMLCVEWLSRTAVHRRASEKRAIAQQEAANILGQVSALEWDAITPAELDKLALSADAAAALRSAELHVRVEPTDEVPAAKQVRVELSWLSPTGGREAPVRLIYWAYQHQPGNQGSEGATP